MPEGFLSRIFILACFFWDRGYDPEVRDGFPGFSSHHHTELVVRSADFRLGDLNHNRIIADNPLGSREGFFQEER